MKNTISFSKLKQYADDSQVYTAFNSDSFLACQTQLNQDLNCIYVYAENHNLKLNASKSCILFLSSNKNKIEYATNNFLVHINNIQIPVVSEAKNLGMIFDSNLTFGSHISKKLSVAYMRLKGLYKLKRHISSQIKYF